MYKIKTSFFTAIRLKMFLENDLTKTVFVNALKNLFVFRFRQISFIRISWRFLIVKLRIWSWADSDQG